jgi:hypothetical protein
LRRGLNAIGRSVSERVGRENRVIEGDDLGLTSGESDYEFAPKRLVLGLAAMVHVGKHPRVSQANF